MAMQHCEHGNAYVIYDITRGATKCLFCEMVEKIEELESQIQILNEEIGELRDNAKYPG